MPFLVSKARLEPLPPMPNPSAEPATPSTVPVLMGLSKAEMEARTKARLDRLKPLLKRTLRLPVEKWTLRHYVSFVSDLPRTHRRTSFAVATGLLILAAAMTYHGIANLNPDVVTRQPLEPVYFYDLSTGKLFPGQRNAAGPVDAPSGGKQGDGASAGVRAYVTSCGGCADPSALRVAYVESFTADSRQAWKDYLNQNSKFVIPIPDPEDPSIPGINSGRLVSRPSPVAWVPIFSKQGREITAELAKSCSDGTAAKQCSP